LYGAPGTGKTLLAKAVANQTSATFLRVVGSELIQKYLGDGPKLVRGKDLKFIYLLALPCLLFYDYYYKLLFSSILLELFRVAEEHAPSIVFIDEIDAIGTRGNLIYDHNLIN